MLHLTRRSLLCRAAMPSSLSPLLGYNTNVRHKGRVFHVQTEDSGVRYGHVTTHLFVDGGRILKSFKSSYAESVGAEEQCEVVRALMKRQHKAMLMALRDGLFDALAEIPSGAGASVAASPTAPAASPKQQPIPQPTGSSKLQSLPPELRAPTSRTHSGLPKVQPVMPKWHPESPPPERKVGPAPQPDRAVARSTSLTNAAHMGSRSPPGAAHERLPRPSVVTAPIHGPSALPSSPRTRIAGSQTPISERRLVPSRPASALARAKVHRGQSIFGEDGSNDKSLDEVILSYLALAGDPEGKV